MRNPSPWLYFDNKWKRQQNKTIFLIGLKSTRKIFLFIYVTSFNDGNTAQIYFRCICLVIFFFEKFWCKMILYIETYYNIYLMKFLLWKLSNSNLMLIFTLVRCSCYLWHVGFMFCFYMLKLVILESRVVIINRWII